MSALPSRRRPIRSIQWFALLAASLLAWGVAADEFVAIGRVEQVTLLPEGTARCPAACQDDASGKTVCVSNTCGCGEALIRIDRVLVGKRRPTALIKYQLGEWCEAEFPLADPAVLIRLSDGEPPRWSPLHPLEAPGELGFETRAFTHIGSVDVGTLEASDGLASLKDLERQLAPAMLRTQGDAR